MLGLEQLVQTLGYMGLFIESFISTGLVFVPSPHTLIIITAGSLLNPFAVGIVAAIGNAIGNLVGYIFGYSGRKISLKEKGHLKKNIDRYEKWFEKHGGFAIIFVFAFTPLPDGLIALFCGITKYDVKKYFLANILGKLALNLLLAYIGFYGINFMLGFL